MKIEIGDVVLFFAALFMGAGIGGEIDSKLWEDRIQDQCLFEGMIEVDDRPYICYPYLEVEDETEPTILRSTRVLHHRVDYVHTVGLPLGGRLESVPA